MRIFCGDELTKFLLFALQIPEGGKNDEDPFKTASPEASKHGEGE
jgi:hypothetical protein